MEKTYLFNYEDGTPKSLYDSLSFITGLLQDSYKSPTVFRCKCYNVEEVNFVRLPYLVNHTISAIKNDTVILLGRSSSKSILLYYIIRELHQINRQK